MNHNIWIRRLIIILAITTSIGWALNPSGSAAENVSKKSPQSLLRVGVTPNYPPIIFKLQGKISGLEADFAVLLGQALQRDVQFVDLSWGDQIQALMEGKIDIVMSGMSITEARKVRVNFSDPYLKSGLAAMFRTGDANKYDSTKKILESIGVVGVVKGTTGEVFVRNRFRSSTPIIPIKDPGEAPGLLNNRRIDLFIHDAPSVVWLVSENEATLKGFWELMNEETLGWAVGRDNPALLNQVNAALAVWKKDGTVQKTVKRWLPYWKFTD
jgi:ABC-type amino acid transport substrate-binding protein